MELAVVQLVIGLHAVAVGADDGEPKFAGIGEAVLGLEAVPVLGDQQTGGGQLGHGLLRVPAASWSVQWSAVPLTPIGPAAVPTAAPTPRTATRNRP